TPHPYLVPRSPGSWIRPRRQDSLLARTLRHAAGQSLYRRRPPSHRILAGRIGGRRSGICGDFGGAMGRIALILTLTLSLSLQDIKWKTNWAESLKEAKASKKLAILVFFNKGLKDCQRFEADTLPNPCVVSALQRHVCAMIDPDATNDDYALGQKHGQ